jgi:hypothetical protein
MRVLPSRRAVLGRLGGLLASIATAAGCDRRPDDDAWSALVSTGVVPDDVAAIELGRLYRELHPEEGSARDLQAALAGTLAPTTPEGWRRHLASAMAADLESAYCLELDGWVMTVTEARLLAVASLAARNGSRPGRR